MSYGTSFLAGVIVFSIFSIVLSSVSLHQFNTDDKGDFMKVMGFFAIGFGVLVMGVFFWNYYQLYNKNSLVNTTIGNKKELTNEEKVELLDNISMTVGGISDIVIFISSIALIANASMGIHHNDNETSDDYKTAGKAVSGVTVGVSSLALILSGYFLYDKAVR